jgi:hypothetical protein
MVKQGKNKGNASGTCHGGPCQKKKEGVSLDEVELTYFMSFLRKQDDAVSLEAAMIIAELQGRICEKVDMLSKLVWK